MVGSYIRSTHPSTNVSQDCHQFLIGVFAGVEVVGIDRYSASLRGLLTLTYRRRFFYREVSLDKGFNCAILILIKHLLAELMNGWFSSTCIVRLCRCFCIVWLENKISLKQCLSPLIGALYYPIRLHSDRSVIRPSETRHE